MTRAQIKGLFYMVVTAALFGYWQQNVLAGLFMMALLLFLEKAVRLLWVSIADVADAVREGAEETDDGQAQ